MTAWPQAVCCFAGREIFLRQSKLASRLPVALPSISSWLIPPGRAARRRATARPACSAAESVAARTQSWKAIA